jgi:hypothetical protein
MKNIRNKIYNHFTNSIVSHYTIQQRLIPSRPYDYIWEKDRAQRTLDNIMKYGQEVGIKCNSIKMSQYIRMGKHTVVNNIIW